MKKIKTLIFALLAAIGLAGVSCSDLEYEMAPMPEGKTIFFDSNVQTSYTLQRERGRLEVVVYRQDDAQAAEEDVLVKYGEGAKGVLTVDDKVKFKAGEKSAKLRIEYNNVKRGVEYFAEVSFANATPYANSNVKFKFIYPKEVVYEWDTISTKAYYIENMFILHGLNNLAISDLVVEKAKDHNIYRMRSPYDNEFFAAVFGSQYQNFFPENYDYPYIVLDGESYKNEYGESLWYIKSTPLGFKCVANAFPARDDKWETFGSAAINLKLGNVQIPADSKEFPLGSYDEARKAFDFGVVYQQVENYPTLLVYNQGAFKLYLDPALMSPDINRDYTWEDRPEEAGFYTTTISPQGWEQSIQQAKQDPTYYRFPELYAEKTPIAFKCDKKTGVVSVFPGQNTGLTTNFGNQVFIEETPGTCKYDPVNEVLTLGLTFYLKDQNGNKALEVLKSTETFLWGQRTELDQLVPGKKLTDYVGKWNAYGVNIQAQAKDTAFVTLSTFGTDKLKAEGMSKIEGYTDGFYIDYDKRTGFLKVSPQPLSMYSDDGGEYEMSLIFVNLTMGGVSDNKAESMIGGFLRSGELKFVNAPTNKAKYEAMVFGAKVPGGFAPLGNRATLLDWEHPAETKAVDMLEPYLLKKTSLFESPFLSGNVVPKRTYMKVLNVEPVVESKKDVAPAQVMMDNPYLLPGNPTLNY